MNRRAEQGDSLGPLFCALVLACVLAHIRDTFAERGIGFFTLRYLDDWLFVSAPDIFIADSGCGECARGGVA